MSGRLAFVIAAGLALSGCCLDGKGCDVPPRAGMLTSWDGLGQPPIRHHSKLAKVPKAIVAAVHDDDHPSEEDLAKLRPYSREWGAALETLNRAADAKLKKKLIICRDCLPPEPDDRTGSLDRTSADRP